MTKSPERDHDAERYATDPSRLDPGEALGSLPVQPSKLSGAVPVRFAPETIERIKRVAAEDKVTVSTWIRRQVDQALDVHDRRSGLMVIEHQPHRGVGTRLAEGRRRRISA